MTLAAPLASGRLLPHLPASLSFLAIGVGEYSWVDQITSAHFFQYGKFICY